MQLAFYSANLLAHLVSVFSLQKWLLMKLGAPVFRLVLRYRREQQVWSPLERLGTFGQSGNTKMFVN